MLNTLLICIVAVQGLSVLLIYDLYGRSGKLVTLVEEARRRLHLSARD
jgi:hypothetical protein